MTRYFPLLLLSFFLFSCGEQKPDEKKNNPAVDPFREDVLKLRSLGLLKNVPDKILDSLIAANRSDSLNGIKNILVYSGEIFPFDLDQDSKDPARDYRKLCKQVGEKIPELAVDTVICSYLPEEPGGKDTDWVLIEQRVKNTSYFDKLYYFRDWRIDETFCKIYNTRLAEEKKDYRIYLVTFLCSDCFLPFSDAKIKQDYKRMGLIRLNKEQGDALLKMESLALDPEDEFSVLSMTEKKDVLHKFEMSGLVTSKDSGWYRAVHDNILQNTVHGNEQFYDFFDTIVCAVNFDTINDYNPYWDILTNMKKISKGKFNPGVVYDTSISPASRTVRFTIGDKVYERDIEQHQGILNPAIVDLVNEALAEQKAGGAFYTIYTRDETASLIYVDDAVAEKAKNSGCFPEFEKGAPPKIKEIYNTAPEI